MAVMEQQQFVWVWVFELAFNVNLSLSSKVHAAAARQPADSFCTHTQFSTIRTHLENSLLGGITRRYRLHGTRLSYTGQLVGERVFVCLIILAQKRRSKCCCCCCKVCSSKSPKTLSLQNTLERERERKSLAHTWTARTHSPRTISEWLAGKR